MDMRIGIGYDSHRFNAKPGPIQLGGVAIPSARGLVGHSDADVLLHAITDALLGAIGAPDIGELFPPTDRRYKGVNSRWFVEQAYRKVQRAGWQVGNVDTTVVADTPTLTPYKTKMRQTISRLLKIAPGAVSVKAKTTEGLAPGSRGIAAHAVVLLKQRKGERGTGRGKGSRKKR